MDQKTKEKVSNAWDSNENSFTFDGTSDAIDNVKAVFYNQGICFHASMNVCNNNRKYPMRGRISIMEPLNNSKVLQVSSKSYEACLKRAGRAFHQAKANHRAMSFEIQAKSASELDVKLAILNKVEKLIDIYGEILLESYKVRVDKRFLTPSGAFLYHANDFAKKALNVTEKTEKEYLSAISQFMTALSDGTKPLADFTAEDIAKTMKQNSRFKKYQSAIQRFFDYCSTKKHLPLKSSEELFSKVKEVPKTKAENLKRAERLTAASIRPNSLDEKHELILLNRLLEGEINYYAPGIALSLWGGFSANEISDMHWSDIFFNSINEYFVCVRLIKTDKTCATQNFTRPIFPDGAHVLHACYAELIRSYTVNEVLKMPIVCEKNDPYQAMSKDNFCRLSTQLLTATGVCADINSFLGKDVSHAILPGTYKNNLMKIFGENPIEEGTFKFLLGESLQFLTTSDNYASFTSEAGEWRMFNDYMARHQVEVITYDKKNESVDEDHHIITMKPKDNHSSQVIIGAVRKLAPGAEITIRTSDIARLSIENTKR